ncbi:AAA domain-containing protein [Sulfitobacter brevis]|uniref:AAA domain-containing protein n=1 Tax=Sulfitobacter brevis TaxID=74348 RepID=A0A1I1UF04_9RHOB|nr:AAA family ATPase [Sulfitobacter brevis]SFD69436.1 AAA domain-containing protein [Sulfitobacter brevis]
MLHSIRYTVTFSTTGKTLTENITFRPGFGILTGANESGKSLVVEMIRWCLFGSAALRGKIGDYKKASARLEIVLKGKPYVIERTASHATLFRGPDQIAVGTTPVNQKVVELFGFGLEVFDASCVALQGEIEALGTMKPAERKRLVDSVIGVGVIEELAKSAGDEANALKRRARDLSQNLRAPEPPPKPDDYRLLSEIDADLADLAKARTRLDHLRGVTTETRSPPTPPHETVSTPVPELQALASSQDGMNARLRAAEMELTALPKPSPYSDSELAKIAGQSDGFQQWQNKQRLLASAPDPGAGVQKVKQAMAFQDAEHLRHRIAALRSKGVHICPSCAHQWPVETASIEAIAADLALVNDVEKPEGVPTERKALLALLRAAQAWEDIQPQLTSLADVHPCERPALDFAEIENHRLRNGYAIRRSELNQEIKSLDMALAGLPDYVAQLRERQRFEDRLALYRDQQTAFDIWQRAFKAAQAEIATLIEPVKGYDKLATLRSAVVLYDTLRIRFELDLQRYTEGMAEVSDSLKEAEDWERARQALTNLRGMVKQHLLPSLNKVASQYLAQMTGGERQIIYADECFAITVDGQALNTLSGSGKAVACLALRLGLGQVLTQGIFPVFIGDEIDASMDQNRTANTAAMFEALKSRLGQILLVTHKRPEADYMIELGGI